MMPAQNMFLYVGLLWCLVASGAQATTPIEDSFRVSWSSVTYGEVVSFRNPEAYPQSPAPSISASLKVRCKIEIGDPNRVIGTYGQLTATSLADSQGRTVPVAAATLSTPGIYKGLQYHSRWVFSRTNPEGQRADGSEPNARSAATVHVQRIDDLARSGATLEFDMSILQSGGKEIQRLEGYFYAMTAETTETVDIPLEPNGPWVRLTPDQEVRVVDVRSTGRPCRIELEERPQRWITSSDVIPENPLPSRMVIDRQVLGPNGALYQGRTSTATADTLPVPITGSGSISVSDLSGATLRYVIAVNPKHNKIPFVLEHIPLPQP